MLVELIVENLAVIERIRVRLHEGLHVLSGETGSGKSIVVDALGLLFGGRASADMIRTGCDRARVSGIFELPAASEAAALLAEAGVDAEDGELLLEREILANGKSRAFAASRPVTAAFLRSLAPLLGDIHGQHDQQRLFDPAEQRALLDQFARHTALTERAASCYRAWKAVAAELEDIDRTEQERLRLADLWAYQVREIESIAPKPGEEESLEHERLVLQNVTRLEQGVAETYDSLYDSPDSAAARVRGARRRLEDLVRIDSSLEPLLEPLHSAAAALEDVSFTLRDYLGRLEADPARLDHLEARLASLGKLKRKYGATIAEVIEFYDRTRAQLDSAENAQAGREKLKAALDRKAAEFHAAAAALRQSRRNAARKLETTIEKELAALAMDRTRFHIALHEAPWSEAGADRIEFLLAANVGEEPKPLDRIASGGELSRVALALKATITALSGGPRRTLVFDEVDAGVGGRAAETLGRRLKRIARHSQVLCVTHLAQIAGFADHHYVVDKRETNGRTLATIEEKTGEARTREISRMLSGQETPEALQHAAQLLQLGLGE